MAEGNFISLKDFATIERDPEKWSTASRSPAHYTNKQGAGFKYGRFSKKLELGEADVVRETLIEDVVLASHPLMFVLRAEMDADEELKLEHYLEQLDMDPLHVATMIKSKITSKPSIVAVDFQVTAEESGLSDIEELVERFGPKMFGEVNWPKLNPIIKGQPAEAYVNTRSRDVTALLRDKAFEFLEQVDPEELVVNVDHHEFSHHVRGNTMVEAGFMTNDIQPDLRQEYEMCNYITNTLDEALAIFSELRGPVTDKLPTINNANRYALYFRLTKLISYDQDAPVITSGGIAARPNSLAEYIRKIQSNSSIDNAMFNEHTLAILLLVMGPDALSTTTDKIATLTSDEASVDHIYERVAAISADPDAFIRSLDGKFYDALYTGLTSRVQRLKDIEDMSTELSSPPEA